VAVAAGVAVAARVAVAAGRVGEAAAGVRVALSVAVAAGRVDEAAAVLVGEAVGVRVAVVPPPPPQAAARTTMARIAGMDRTQRRLRKAIPPRSADARCWYLYVAAT